MNNREWDGNQMNVRNDHSGVREPVVKGLSAIHPIGRFAVIASLPLLMLAGCSDLGVKPWERGTLAKPEMQLVSDPVEAGLDDHIYFSKEATSGGRSFGGGGCGCN